MTTETIIAHAIFSLDLVSPINVKEELDFVKLYPLIQKTFLNITEEGIRAFKRSFKHISEEGYITTWYDHLDDIPTSGFILVTENGYRKEFGVDTPEECCRWQYNELYIL